MDRYEARKAMVADLEEQGYLVKVVPHSHNVGTHDRCHTTVEPMVKQQWFVKMDELAKPAINAIKTGELKLDVYKRQLHRRGVSHSCVSLFFIFILWGSMLKIYCVNFFRVHTAVLVHASPPAKAISEEI